MPPASDPQLRLLVRHSAAPKDLALAEELLGHLRPLERFAGLDIWSDARIRAGDDWRREIARAIQEADVALLLLSADFFASDGLVEVEVPQLLERHRAGKLRVIPVLLRSCLWDVHRWLKELHPLPKGGKPVGAYSGEDRDAVLTELAREIVGLTTPATGSTDHPVQTNQPAPKTGGDTYHIEIHGSTIGALGAGQGVKVTGGVNAGPGVPAGSARSTTERSLKPDPTVQLREMMSSIGMHSIYLSYDPADQRFVARLYGTLGPYNLLCYVAEHAQGGERFGQVARIGINQHDRIVLVCSKRSLSNPKVLSDLEETLERETREGGSSRLILLDLDGFAVSPEWRPLNSSLAGSVLGRRVISMIGADREAGPLAVGMAKLVRALNGLGEL